MNPLAMAGQVATFQNQMNQNKLFPLQQQEAQTKVQADKLNLARGQFSYLAQRFGNLSFDPDLTFQKMSDLAADLVSQSVLSPQIAAQELGQMPANADPSVYQKIAKQYQYRALTAAEQFGAANPAPQIYNNGPSAYAVTLPEVGAPSASRLVPNGMSPGDAGNPFLFVGPNGEQRAMTKGQFVGAVGGGQGQDMGDGRFSSQPGGSGMISPLAVTPDQPQNSAPAPAPATNKAPGIQVGLAPGVAETATATAAANVGQQSELQRAATTVPNQKAVLSQMLDDVSKFSPGPGSDLALTFKSGLQTWLPQLAFSFGIDPNSIASQQSFNKLTNQLQLAQQSQLGGAGTDMSRMTVHGATPSGELSKQGIVDIVHMLQGNSDAIAALQKKWAIMKSENPAADWSSFVADNAKNFDPRAFQAMYMSPEQKADLRKRLTDQELPAFKATAALAKSLGYGPNGMAPNAGQ